MSGTKLSVITAVAVLTMALAAISSAFGAKDTVVPTPKEYGVYAKTAKGLSRIIPNIVSDFKGVYYLETNNPQKFPLGSIEYFVLYGNHQYSYLTLNPMIPFQQTGLGIQRFMFGKDIELTVVKKTDTLYAVKPKGLFGRGYYALWIEDSAWDFVVE